MKHKSKANVAGPSYCLSTTEGFRVFTLFALVLLHCFWFTSLINPVSSCSWQLFSVTRINKFTVNYLPTTKRQNKKLADELVWGNLKAKESDTYFFQKVVVTTTELKRKWILGLHSSNCQKHLKMNANVNSCLLYGQLQLLLFVQNIKLYKIYV